MSASEQQEIEAVAKQIWLERGGVGGSAEDDWYRASEIVRNRHEPKGNSPRGSESYRKDTDPDHTDEQSKEKSHMDNTMTGSMEDTRRDIGSRASDMANRANEMMDREPKNMPRMEHREGRVARTLEQQTARIPSDAWLWAALGAMGLSLALELSGRDKTSTFVGHWVPTLLIFGVYNKMVKLQGSDGA